MSVDLNLWFLSSELCTFCMPSSSSRSKGSPRWVAAYWQSLLCFLCLEQPLISSRSLVNLEFIRHNSCLSEEFVGWWYLMTLSFSAPPRMSIVGDSQCLSATVVGQVRCLLHRRLWHPVHSGLVHFLCSKQVVQEMREYRGQKLALQTSYHYQMLTGVGDWISHTQLLFLNPFGSTTKHSILHVIFYIVGKFNWEGNY